MTRKKMKNTVLVALIVVLLGCVYTLKRDHDAVIAKYESTRIELEKVQVELEQYKQNQSKLAGLRVQRAR